jgi:uncharacterized protein (DUF433 family)
MQLEDYFDFLGPDVIRLKGHRINIEHIVRCYHDGYSPEQIASEFPGLSLEQIHATITYYLRNRVEVDALLVRLSARAEQDYQVWAASPAAQRLHLLREKQAAYESSLLA